MQHFNRLAAIAALFLTTPLLILQPAHSQLIEDGSQPAAPALAAAWARYGNVQGAHLAGWLADGSLLIREGVCDGAASFIAARLVRIAEPLAEPEVLGPGDPCAAGAAPHPFDARLLAVQLQTADGHTQLHTRHIGEADSRPLTDASAHDDVPIWAPDGRSLAFTSDRRNGADVDVYIVGQESAGPPRLIAGGGGRWQLLDWSRDGRSLLLKRDGGTEAGRLFVADVASGSFRPISTADVIAARFTPDGGAVLYSYSGDGSGFITLAQIAVDGTGLRTVLPRLEHDIEHFELSADGRYLAYSWRDAGYSHLGLLDQRNHIEVTLPAGLPQGVIHAMRFNRDGSSLAFEIGTTTTPPEIHVIDIAAATIRRWTRSDRNPAAAGAFTPARRIHFRTWDRSDGVPRMLGGFLYLPGKAGPHSVLIRVHDGPGGESRPGFDAWVQFLVNELGIAVIEPNLRGSGGAGAAFAALDDGPLREDAIRDLGSLLVWIGTQRNLDAGRVAVAGAGHGAYQAITALAKYGDRLSGAVAIDPLPDLVAAADAATIARPVLLVRLARPVAGRLSGAEQILWRMRGTRRDARYLALDAARCTTGCRAERAAIWAAIGGYLDELLGAKLPDPSSGG